MFLYDVLMLKCYLYYLLVFSPWSLRITSFFVFCYRVCVKVYIVWYEYCYSCFLVCICMRYPFPSPYFQPVCVFSPGRESLVGSILKGLIDYLISHPMSFNWNIQSIDILSNFWLAVLTAILLLIFWLLCNSSVFFFLFRCALKIFFSNMLMLFSL